MGQKMEHRIYLKRNSLYSWTDMVCRVTASLCKVGVRGLELERFPNNPVLPEGWQCWGRVNHTTGAALNVNVSVPNYPMGTLHLGQSPSGSIPADRSLLQFFSECLCISVCHYYKGVQLCFSQEFKVASMLVCNLTYLYIYSLIRVGGSPLVLISGFVLFLFLLCAASDLWLFILSCCTT